MVSSFLKSAIHPASLIMVDSVNQTDGETAVIDREVQRVRKLSPKYKVLLHNDPVNTMDYVVDTLRQVVPQLSEQDALNIMLETHNNGVGLVITCDLEPAEFYSESLKAKGLTSTIELESWNHLSTIFGIDGCTKTCNGCQLLLFFCFYILLDGLSVILFTYLIEILVQAV